jgi:hypothetical protein
MSDYPIHPYLADLPIFDDEVEAIAESIREVGLLHPLTLDTESQIIGGRHRLAACERAGVEPTFETHEGDALAFILHDNATRKHQTTGQRAAENALALNSAGKRKAGRWSYGDVISQGYEISSNERNYASKCGVILDYLGLDALLSVARGDQTLNEVSASAEEARDAEQNRLDAERRDAEAEGEAQKFVTENAPDLAARVDGSDLETYREAEAIWQQRNREEAARIKAEKEREAKEKRERESALTHTYTRIATFLQIAATYGANDDPASIMADYSKRRLDPPQLERWFAPKELANARRFVDALIEWSS